MIDVQERAQRFDTVEFLDNGIQDLIGPGKQKRFVRIHDQMSCCCLFPCSDSEHRCEEWQSFIRRSCIVTLFADYHLKKIRCCLIRSHIEVRRKVIETEITIACFFPTIGMLWLAVAVAALRQVRITGTSQSEDCQIMSKLLSTMFFFEQNLMMQC